MSLCYNPIFLTILMYLKYIIVIVFVLLLILKFKLQKSDLINKIIVYILSIIILYFIALVLFNYFDISLKNCINNSNPKNIDYVSKIYETYNGQNEIDTTDAYLDKIQPVVLNKIIGGKEIYVYNQNDFPLSKYEFTFTDSYNGYSMKKSGNEIATLASLFATIVDNDEIDPSEVLEILKDKNYNPTTEFDMNIALQYLSEKYEVYYKPITSSEVMEGLRRGGIVLAKTSGAPDGNIFTCSDSYILLYNYDNSSNISLVSSNDKDYDFYCPVGTKGFGNVVRANINSTLYYSSDVMGNTDEYILIWR